MSPSFLACQQPAPIVPALEVLLLLQRAKMAVYKLCVEEVRHLSLARQQVYTAAHPTRHACPAPGNACPSAFDTDVTPCEDNSDMIVASKLKHA